MTRRFTGSHMLAIMIGFFGLVIAVNVVMAKYAITTFGGEVVANSYVASQRFDDWLAQGRAQAKRGWRVAPSVDARGRLHLVVADARGVPIAGQVRVIARHPLGLAPDRVMTLTPAPPGYVSSDALPGGRWLLHIAVRAGGAEARFEDELRA